VVRIPTCPGIMHLPCVCRHIEGIERSGIRDRVVEWTRYRDVSLKTSSGKLCWTVCSIMVTCCNVDHAVGEPNPVLLRERKSRESQKLSRRRHAFTQASEIYPPSECPSFLRERNPAAPLPIHRSDEFRPAIPWQVARQQGLPPLHRPLAMLKRNFATCQVSLASTSDRRLKQTMSWQVRMAGFELTTEAEGDVSKPSQIGPSK
jgi:hypothetical protein